MMSLLSIILIFTSLFLLWKRKAYLAWVLPIGIALGETYSTSEKLSLAFYPIAAIFLIAAIVVGFPLLRRKLITSQVFRILKGVLPKISETERIALEAGTVGWDAELFSGNPKWKELLDFSIQELSSDEQAFLDGPVEQLCEMLDDHQIQIDHDLPKDIWQFILDQRFFGIIIPKEHGGLGFSAAANSAIVRKLSSRSVTASVSVMVPNSLGPAELLLHYGTDEQKERYLEALATGKEIPCFALTEPGAGSDAASITSNGVICKGEFEGVEQLGIKLNWNKRYITLAPIATVLGLAFRLFDPDSLIGDKEDLGLTCALIPTHLDGITTGERHDPLGVPFLNGPTQGVDVFVPLSAIIGGQDMAGKGWLMLMQCLSAGRGISLPSLSVGAAQLSLHTVASYGNVREQFGIPISSFEGIQEPMARIGALTYLMDASRKLTHGFVDNGEKPAVASAIVKYYLTELMRDTVNDAMDIQGGAAICKGPRNILAGPYASIPIGITVEGANILTRTLIIFGQGAIRCHPHVLDQMHSIEGKDLKKFDKAFCGHVAHTISNVLRSFVFQFTGGRPLSGVPGGAASPYFRRLTRLSAIFATIADSALASLGGALKRKEILSGRLADALGWMYLASATLKRFENGGQQKDEVDLMRWSLQHACYNIEQALLGAVRNMPNRPLSWGLRLLCFAFGARYAPPSDRLTTRVARQLSSDRNLLAKMSSGIYMAAEDSRGLGQLDAAAQKVAEASEVKSKMKQAVSSGKLDKNPRATLAERALKDGVITKAEEKLMQHAKQACEDVVQVDSFKQDQPSSHESEASATSS